MFGDSFLSGIRENVDLSLSSKYSLYSLVKPGCKLNCLIESTSKFYLQGQAVKVEGTVIGNLVAEYEEKLRKKECVPR
jgi:hypothetical protein